jgi:phosphopantothenoylcysteine decarboxylase
MESRKDVLYHVVCAAPPAQYIQDFIISARESWDVCVIATPQALRFLDLPMLEELTGHSVRSEYKHSRIDADIFPKMDAMVVAPMTLNTTTKWAQGNADNLALSQLCKGLGLQLPIVAAPCISGPFSRHPAFSASITLLRENSIHVLYDPEQHPAPNIVPWSDILQRLNSIKRV